MGISFDSVRLLDLFYLPPAKKHGRYQKVVVMGLDREARAALVHMGGKEYRATEADFGRMLRSKP